MAEKKSPIPESKLAAAALGAIEPEHLKEHARALDIIEKRNAVLDRIIAFEEQLAQVRGVSPQVKEFLDNTFSKLVLEFTNEFAGDADTGERALQRMEGARSLERSGYLSPDAVIIPGELKTEGAHAEYVTGAQRAQELNKNYTAIEEESAKAGAMPWYNLKRYGARRRVRKKAGALTKTLITQSEEQSAANSVAAKRIAKNWNTGKLDAWRDSLSRLETVVHALRLIQSAIESGTPLQKVSAESAQVSLDRLARMPDSKERAEEAEKRIAELEIAMNFQERSHDLDDELRETEIDMHRQLAELETSVSGLAHLDTLIPLKTSASSQEVQDIRDKLYAAARDAREAYSAAHDAIEKMHAQFAQAADASMDEKTAHSLHGLVEAVSNGDIRNLITHDFNAAVARARDTLEKLRATLQLSRPALASESQRQSLLASPDTLSARTQEGKELTFHLKEQLAYWGDFYRNEHIDWVTLPDAISLTEDQIKGMQELMAQGFDKMIILPANLVDTPTLTIDPSTKKPTAIKNPRYEQLHQLMSQGYQDTYQGTNYQNDGSFQGAQDKTTALRIILTKDAQNLEDDPLFNPTKGKSIEDLEKDELTRYTGFSEATYLIYQREYFKRTGKHLDEKDWTWLPESTRPLSGRVSLAYWIPNDSQLLFYSNTRVIRSDYLGCRLAGSFEII